MKHRCARVFTEEPKKIPMTNSPTAALQKPKTTAAAIKTLALIEKQKKEAMEQIQKKYQLADGLKWVFCYFWMYRNFDHIFQMQ